MKQTAMTHYEKLNLALSHAQGESAGEKAPQPLNAAGQKPDANAKRYEQLAHASKTFIFTVVVKDGHAAYTVYYPGVFRITGYTMEEYSTQPQLWFSMIHADDKEIVLQQIERLLRGETPPPIKHRVTRKDGSICWLRNTSVPVFDSQGKLVAYDGLLVDISEAQFTEEEHEHQIAELTAALAMVKALHSLLPICCSCKKIRDDEGYWEQIEDYIQGHYSAISFTHGICPDCSHKLYPEFSDDSSRSDVGELTSNQ